MTPAKGLEWFGEPGDGAEGRLVRRGFGRGLAKQPWQDTSAWHHSTTHAS